MSDHVFVLAAFNQESGGNICFYVLFHVRGCKSKTRIRYADVREIHWEKEYAYKTYWWISKICLQSATAQGDKRQHVTWPLRKHSESYVSRFPNKSRRSNSQQGGRRIQTDRWECNTIPPQNQPPSDAGPFSRTDDETLLELFWYPIQAHGVCFVGVFRVNAEMHHVVLAHGQEWSLTGAVCINTRPAARPCGMPFTFADVHQLGFEHLELDKFDFVEDLEGEKWSSDAAHGVVVFSSASGKVLGQMLFRACPAAWVLWQNFYMAHRAAEIDYRRMMVRELASGCLVRFQSYEIRARVSDSKPAFPWKITLSPNSTSSENGRPD